MNTAYRFYQGQEGLIRFVILESHIPVAILSKFRPEPEVVN
jgi:hypothetical protein